MKHSFKQMAITLWLLLGALVCPMRSLVGGAVDLTICFKDKVIRNNYLLDETIGENGSWHQLFQRVSARLYEATKHNYWIASVTLVTSDNNASVVIRHSTGKNYPPIAGTDMTSKQIAINAGHSCFTSISGDKQGNSDGIIMHELGHALFKLRDEYAYTIVSEKGEYLYYHKDNNRFDWGSEKGMGTGWESRFTYDDNYASWKSTVSAKPSYSLWGIKDGKKVDAEVLLTAGTSECSVGNNACCIMNGWKPGCANQFCDKSNHNGEGNTTDINNREYLEELSTKDKIRVKIENIQESTNGCSCWEHIGSPKLASNPCPTVQWILPQEELSNETIIFVLDHSGSMSGGRLINCQTSIKRRLEEIENQNEQILATNNRSLLRQVGLVLYSSSARLAVAPQPLLKKNGQRDRLVRAVDGVQANGLTASGDALILAAHNFPAQSVRNSVVLFTDGQLNTGASWWEAFKVLDNKKVYAIDFSGGARLMSAQANTVSSLRELVEQSGGSYVASTDESAIERLFEVVTQQATGASALPSTEGVAQGAPIEREILIDAYCAGTTTIKLSWSGAPMGLEMVAPSGQVYTREAMGEGNLFTEGVESCLMSFSNPEVGIWTARILPSADSDQTYNLAVSAMALDTITLHLEASLANVQDRNPIWLRASLACEFVGTQGATVTAVVQAPDKTTSQVMLYDDGLEIHGDAAAGDGVYSNYEWDVPMDGDYIITCTYIHPGGDSVDCRYVADYSPAFGTEAPRGAYIAPFAREAVQTVRVAGTPLFINATRYTETSVGDWAADASTGALVGALTVSNDATSRKTLKAPFWYALTGTESVRLAQVDGYTVEGDAYVDITEKVEAALLARYGRTTMLPGESVTVDGIQIYTADRTQPELTALWALWADPPADGSGAVDVYDTDGDGVLGDHEMLKAVHDWTGADMDDLSLLQRIRLWKQGAEK